MIIETSAAVYCDTATTFFLGYGCPEESLNIAGYNYYHMAQRNEDSLSECIELLQNDRLTKKLLELYSMPDDWDGYGAASISLKVTMQARLFIDSFTSRNILEPELVPNTNGTISFEWETESGFFHVEIGEEDYSMLYGLDNGCPSGHQDSGLPDMMLIERIISMLFGDHSARSMVLTEYQYAA
jgi:hypothetical protein